MRKIPFKNYILLLILLVVSTFVFLLVFNLFDKNQKVKEVDFKQLNFNEIDNYIFENPDIIIYFANNDSIQKKYYKKFKSFVDKNYIANNVVYIDNQNISKNDFLRFISKYSNKKTNISLNNYIIIIDEQKVYSIISIDDENPNMDIIKEKLIEIGVL